MLVIEKEVKRRVDLVVIPDEVFNVFLDTHVHRNIPQRTYRQETTVIVSHSKDWSGVPRDGEIADFLALAIRKQKIEERRMLPPPMPHMVFSSLRVRIVNGEGAFCCPEREVNFVLSVKRFQSVRDLDQYGIGELEKHTLRGQMQKAAQIGGLFFLVEHLHVEGR